jgi:hypothetical protein
MTTNLTARIASVALALLMTAGMMGSIQGFAKAEARMGAANALVAQAGQPATRA